MRNIANNYGSDLGMRLEISTTAYIALAWCKITQRFGAAKYFCLEILNGWRNNNNIIIIVTLHMQQYIYTVLCDTHGLYMEKAWKL